MNTGKSNRTTALLRLVLCVLLAMTMALTACNSPKTPMGSDKDVQELVLEIATDEIRRQIAIAQYMIVTSMSVHRDTPAFYETLVAHIDSGKNREIVAFVDDAIKNGSIELANIRTDSIQENLKKSTSSADLIMSHGTVPITYTAQITADGNLYVEVFGLQ